MDRKCMGLVSTLGGIRLVPVSALQHAKTPSALKPLVYRGLSVLGDWTSFRGFLEFETIVNIHSIFGEHQDTAT